MIVLAALLAGQGGLASMIYLLRIAEQSVCLLAVFTQLWPYLAEYVTAEVHPRLDPLFAKHKPKWIRNIRLTRQVYMPSRDSVSTLSKHVHAWVKHCV